MRASPVDRVARADVEVAGLQTLPHLPALSELEQQLFERTNAARLENNLPTLTEDPETLALARWRATVLVGMHWREISHYDAAGQAVLPHLLRRGAGALARRTLKVAGRPESSVDRLLAQHFPLREGEVNPNELPDAPLVI